MNFDINRMKRSDQVIAVCGALLFISLFLPFFGLKGFPGSGSGHASGFLAWAGLWLGFLAGGLGFFTTLGVPWPAQLPVTKTIATLGVSALATLLLVLKFVIGYHISGLGVSVHLDRKFGLYFAVIAVIVQVVFAVLAFRESGESLPTKASFSGLGKSGSASGLTPPPSQGFGPPPSFGGTASGAGQQPVQSPPPANWQNPQPPTEGS